MITQIFFNDLIKRETIEKLTLIKVLGFINRIFYF